MKKAFLKTMAALVILGTMSAVSHAAVYTYTPLWSNLDNLDHGYAYTWAMTLNLAPYEYITEAELTFKNIYDWVAEDSDRLYTSLLDNSQYFACNYDGESVGNYYAGQGVAVATWTDPMGGSARNFDLVYTFSSLGLINTLSQYIADNGRFGLGIDPDCHYYNSGVTFKVTTAIPEPGSMMLMGMGLLGLVGFVKKKVS